MTIEKHTKTKIKICGLRRREDILAVNEAKPDYCGFIIEFPRSFRSITADKARELVRELSPKIRAVGVFVNAPMELVRDLLNDGTIALAQLHGQEDESYIRELKKIVEKPVIKAFSVKIKEDIEKAILSPADYILLDQGGGGTGKTFDWSLIPEIRREFFSCRRAWSRESEAGNPGNRAICCGFEQQCGDRPVERSGENQAGCGYCEKKCVNKLQGNAVI